MPIWEHHHREPPAGEAQENQAAAQADEAQADEAQADEAGHQTGEPARAFWRAQGAAGTHEADAGEPAVPGAGEAAAAEAGAPLVTAAGQPAVTEDPEPEVTRAPEPAVTEAPEPEVTEAPEPEVTRAPEPAAAEVVPPAAASPAPPDGISPQRWSEILMTFVDDPRGSVQMAADAVDVAIDEFVTSVRARQRALASTWHSTETDTEQLRVALRDYRKFWHQVRQLGLSGKTG